MLRKILERTTGTERRDQINKIAAFFAGVIFFTGWWFMIDVNARFPVLISERKVYYVPGVFATIAFILINSIPASVLSNDFYYENRCTICFGRIILFVGFFVCFSSLIGGLYIYIEHFGLTHAPIQWPGIGVLLQNLFIVVATFMYKFLIINEEFI